MAQPTFEQVYPVLYKGWDRESARADFKAGNWTNKAGAEQFTGGGAGAGTSGPVSVDDATSQLESQLGDILIKIDEQIGSMPIDLTDEERDEIMDKAIEEIKPYFDKKEEEIKKGIKEGKIQDAEDLLIKIQDAQQEARQKMEKYDLSKARTEKELVNSLADITATEEEDVEMKRASWQERVRKTKGRQVGAGTLTSGVGQKRIGKLREREEMEVGAIQRRAETKRTKAKTQAKYDRKRIEMARKHAQENLESIVGTPSEAQKTIEKAMETAGYDMPGAGAPEGGGPGPLPGPTPGGGMQPLGQQPKPVTYGSEDIRRQREQVQPGEKQYYPGGGRVQSQQKPKPIGRQGGGMQPVRQGPQEDWRAPQPGEQKLQPIGRQGGGLPGGQQPKPVGPGGGKQYRPAVEPSPGMQKPQPLRKPGEQKPQYIGRPKPGAPGSPAQVIPEEPGPQPIGRQGGGMQPVRQGPQEDWRAPQPGEQKLQPIGRQGGGTQPDLPGYMQPIDRFPQPPGEEPPQPIGRPGGGTSWAGGMPSQAEIMRRRSERNQPIYDPTALTDIREERKKAKEAMRGELEEEELAIKRREWEANKRDVLSRMAEEHKKLAPALYNYFGY